MGGWNKCLKNHFLFLRVALTAVWRYRKKSPVGSNLMKEQSTVFRSMAESTSVGCDHCVLFPVV
ncbi:MAG TPA: hypothetical protein DEO40_04880 [Treponema sp.]|nr:hypothetical protein [Treponema sp.]